MTSEYSSRMSSSTVNKQHVLYYMLGVAVGDAHHVGYSLAEMLYDVARKDIVQGWKLLYVYRLHATPPFITVKYSFLISSNVERRYTIVSIDLKMSDSLLISSLNFKVLMIDF